MIWHLFKHAFLHWTGADNVSGPEYGFWSGFGSDLSEVSIALSILASVRTKNCHRRWCWRVGHFDYHDPDTGVTRKFCHRHHPAQPPKHHPE